ncbi:chromosome partitioning protein [Deinococcus soli (ex Cha et al. 2016)]|uniref:Chromosome partitioning protein n=1 Tax=Deinococcus soli (ex Cha et al. 2016) TaxID=1309411 RepID=A0AAE4BN80_9DEIO|nr:type II toxin-antitoxin system prevent-host-death family antitoxin [Deinococcus soli (ex Cha et al. 2016)]MDR6218451.1 chromosome partitioning protein [Deinococcus soli (ex Cha et al. 2016)]
MTDKPEEMGVTEIRKNLRSVLRRIDRDHAQVIILNNGAPVAALIPIAHFNRNSTAPRRIQPRPVTPHPGGLEMTKVITFFSNAGGVGKTSATRDFGYELAQQGYRVLLIDLDSQANLTDWLGATIAEDIDVEEERHHTMFSAIVNGDPLPEPVTRHGMDIIPSGISVTEIEGHLSNKRLGGENLLRQALLPVRQERRYDFILIDSPPTLGKIVNLCLMASDEIVVPVSSRNKGYRAVAMVHSKIDEFREENPNLNIATHLVTQLNNTSHSKVTEEVVRDTLTNVSGPLRHRPAVYDNCQLEMKPVGAYEPNGEARKEVIAAVKQMLSYIGVAS